ncbi:putative protein of unknown function DUF723 [Vibrio phage 141O35-1]|nr:putative protein of unknown function DUF723 [Vibrio phage 141O35-1]CAH9015737.1 putative protein of unknown function DUF723 [Vibrio phage 141E35-1]
MRKLTRQEYLEKCTIVHGSRYDYSKVKYVNGRSLVTITCNHHGDFQQIAKVHALGSGCPKCANNVVGSASEFERKAASVHGKRYDYSRVIYKGRHVKVVIDCEKHGMFEQTPHAHLRGEKCIACSKEESTHNTKKTTSHFCAEMTSKYGDAYDYSRIEYVNYHTDVTVGCPSHGYFKKTPHALMKGQACPFCTIDSVDKGICYLYVMRVEGLMKVGITKNLGERQASLNGTGFDHVLLKHWRLPTRSEARRVEKHFHDVLSRHSSSKLKGIQGWTEHFDIDKNTVIAQVSNYMRDFYIKHMIEAHERGDYVERNNYAKAAGIDVIEYFYTNA